MNSRSKTSRFAGLLLAHLCAFTLCARNASAQAVKPDAAPVPPPQRKQASLRDSQIQRTPPAATTDEEDEEVVKMGTFEVTASSRGYYADVTTAGTRLGSKIEDLGASITVVTTEMMDDFGMLDLNDIFNFEASTEGIATYTDVTVDDNGNVTDGNMNDPRGANRIRGMRSPTRTYGNFETVRFPSDRLITGRSTEIIRGPSSIISGLGSPAGTINASPATAHLSKNKTEVRLRVDSNNGFRQSLDVNRVLIRRKFAIGFQQLYQHQGFQRKPSGAETELYNFLASYRPFKNTNFDVSYTRYRTYGNRPNSITPYDGITPWKERGEITYDPTTGYYYDKFENRVSNNGLLSTNHSNAYGRSLIFVDRGGVILWTPSRGSSDPNNAFANDQSSYSYMRASAIPIHTATLQLPGDPEPVVISPVRANFVRGISDKSLYDWTNVNIAATDRFYQDNNAILAKMSQVFIDTQKQYLALELGWFREDSSQYNKSLAGISGKGSSGWIAVDVNRKLLDGSNNLNFKRPYLFVTQDVVTESPMKNDSYRAQVAYTLDFRQDKGWTKWFGSHSFTGYAEYKHYELRNVRYRHAITSNHVWLPEGTPRATTNPINAANQHLLWNQRTDFFPISMAFYYIGDPVGQNIDYSPGTLNAGRYPYTWGNVANVLAGTGVINQEYAELGLAGDLNGTGALNNTLKISKGAGIVIQSHLLRNGLVVTAGIRRDSVHQKEGVASQLLPDGITPDHAWNNQWIANWRETSGNTNALGFVIKPAAWIKQNSPSWIKPLRFFSFFYNQSSSIDLVADGVAFNLKGERLPAPTGKGKDYGFNLQLFNGRLILRANRYENYIENARTRGAYLTRAIQLDIYDINYGAEDDEDAVGSARMFSLNKVAADWVRRQAARDGILLTDDEVFLQTAAIMQMDPERLRTLQYYNRYISETQDEEAKGYEVSLSWMPTTYLQFRLNASRAEARNLNIAPGFAEYLEERWDLWQNLVDPFTGGRWWTTIYNPSATSYTARNMWEDSSSGARDEWIATQANTGISNPAISKYSVGFLATLNLSGLTDHRILRGISISPSVRWQSKIGIGEYGILATDPNTGEPVKNDSGLYYHIRRDPTNVVWDTPLLFGSLSISYKTKLFKGKVPATFRFHANNIFEDGRIRPIRTDTHGIPLVYRIIDPRSFTLEADFNF